MTNNPLNKGVLTENFLGIGTVTQKMVHARACELALIAGRVPPDPSQEDYQQAKGELTGGTDPEPQDEMFELVPESERWDPVPGSTGSKSPESVSEDEDSEGRSETEQLVEQGVEEAGHDQMFQAARAAERIEKRDS